MTSPQLENGFIQIAVEFWEAICRARISGTERQILDTIIRKTWGFKKKSDKISNSQFCKATGLKKVAVCKSVNSLIEKNIVTKNGNDNPPSYSIQKNYTLWRLLPKKVTVTKNGNGVTKFGNELLPKMVPTKDINTKETNTKENPPLKRRCRLPENFHLTEHLREHAVSKNIDPEKVDELFVAFKNYHESHGNKMLDWNKAWYTYVGNAPQFSPWAMKQEKPNGW